MFVTDAPDASLVAGLEECGFDVASETPNADVYERLLILAPDLVVIDFASAERAIKFLKGVRSSVTLDKTSVLVLATWGTGQASLALSNGADAFEPKPIDAARLLDAVERLMRPRLVMTAKAID